MTIFTGKTVEEAIETGLRELGISKEKAHVQVKQIEKKGVMGFGKKWAEVDIEPIANHIKEQADRQAVRGVPEEVLLQAEPVKSASEATVELSQVVQAVKLAEQQSNTTGEKADIASIKEAVLRNKTVSEEVQQLTDETPIVKEIVEKQVEDTKEMPVIEIPEEPVTKETPIFLENLDEKAATMELSKFLSRIAKELGAPALVRVTHEENQVIVFNLESTKQGILIGKHGKVLNSLQYLAQVFVHRVAAEKMNVVVNIGEYRQKRKIILERLAERTAQTVKRTGQPVFLEPMPAYERKQIHAALSADPYITTHSEGDDPYRYLVVEKSGKQI